MTEAGDAKQRLVSQIAAAVESRLGAADPRLKDLIAQEVTNVVAGRPAAESLIAAARAAGSDTAERIVVTSTGRNRPGVVARLATVIDEFQGDIREISQTIVGDYFTMIFVVDISGATSQGTRFATLKERLLAAGRDLGVNVVVLHDDILSSMHTV
ncbi:MAG: ACT domain-containing protein [Deltaproteobacteria bacterium]|nr:ACT domain-containing protein [Deltaproteobacteria bacterium]